MTDREMLELAAKSISLVGEYVTNWDNGEYQYSGETEGILYIREDRLTVVWNPLSNDGDALRLAVKLRIDVFFHASRVEGHVAGGRIPPVHAIEREDYGDDPYAATRRAIVRAAAEIGRCMK